MGAPAGRLDRASVRTASRALALRDPRLARLHASHGPPPLWSRRPGFPTLLRIVLEQQVSLHSADAAWRRLAVASGGRVGAASLLRFTDAELRAIGFSRQKVSYARDLARAVLGGSIRLSGLSRLEDDEVRLRLMTLRGVGPWSADIYLVMALGRPDVWPAGDLALRVAQAEVLGLDGAPDPAGSTAIADAWRPWRSVAARMLWQAYLIRRGRPLA